MKKLFAFLFALSLLLSAAVPASASRSDELYIVDDAYLLTAVEKETLLQRIQELRDELELDIVIVTTYGTGGKSVQEYADDFYDNNGYGYGSDNSGILLLLDMENREWYMSTCGEAIYIFTDYGLEELGQEILPDLSNGDYFSAFSRWIDALPYYVQQYRNGSPADGYVQPDDYESVYGDEIYHYDDHVGFRIRHVQPAVFIGLAAALITVLIMRSSMNTAKMQKNAVDYMKSGSFHLRQRSDMFLYSRVSRVARPKNNTSGGGGSSVHRSSGGARHGGRGGRF